MTSSCPLLSPTCKRDAMLNPPFKKPKCPLEDILQQSKSQCSRSLCSSKSSMASSARSAASRNLPPDPQENCPLSPCPSPPPKFKMNCPLSECPPIPSCPLVIPPASSCPLNPPEALCPLNPPPPPSRCDIPPPAPICPLNIPTPGCPMNVPNCPSYPPTCPLEPKKPTGPCEHAKFLEKSIKAPRKPLPPPVCKEISKRCPFDPMALMCHDNCLCLNVPDIDAGPPCPFAPKEVVCPPVCPMMKRPQCPLVKNPPCLMSPPPQQQHCCPLNPPQMSECGEPPKQQTPVCLAANVNICPSFLKLPNQRPVARGCEMESPPANKNVFACPFCPPEEEKPVKTGIDKEPLFHIPTCPKAKTACPIHPSPPLEESFCPFSPCPCPITQTMDCPIKVPSLQPCSEKAPEAANKKNDISDSRKNPSDKKGKKLTNKDAASNEETQEGECQPSIGSQCSKGDPKCPLIDMLKNAQEEKEHVIQVNNISSDISKQKSDNSSSPKIPPEPESKEIKTESNTKSKKNSPKCPINQPLKCPLIDLMCSGVQTQNPDEDSLASEKCKPPMCSLSTKACPLTMENCPFGSHRNPMEPPRCPFAPPEISDNTECLLKSLMSPQKNCKNVNPKTAPKEPRKNPPSLTGSDKSQIEEKGAPSLTGSNKISAESKLDGSVITKLSCCGSRANCPLAAPRRFLTDMNYPCPVKDCQNRETIKSGKTDYKVPSNCPVKTKPCAMFPQGRCQMGDLGGCDCPFPVPPCMAPLTCDAEPPEQYCLKKDCCMGLPRPSLAAAKNLFGGPFYKFQELHPGREDTKYYAEISDVPFNDSDEDIRNGNTAKARRPNWLIIKNGHGYEKCKKVADILRKRGDVDHKSLQYDKSDCIFDDRARRLKESTKEALKRASSKASN